MIILPDWLQNWLLRYPEYGMGYQKVKAKLGTGGVEVGIVVNTQVFLKESEVPWQMAYTWDLVLKEASKTSLRITDADLIPRPAETLKGVRRVALTNRKNAYYSEASELSAYNTAGPAKDAPISLTVAGEVFKRFSAYRNDRRVTPSMGLMAGTYATTKEDADANIRTGTDAVHRYALENKAPASNVFTITPYTGTELNRGIVEPAYGEPGGGVEVIFTNGSADRTVTGPVQIPDK